MVRKKIKTHCKKSKSIGIDSQNSTGKSLKSQLYYLQYNFDGSSDRRNSAMAINVLKLLFLIAFNVTLVTCSRILVLFYHHGPSHFYSFYPLFNELAVRGHNVTVLSYSHVQNPHKNYNELLLTEMPVLNGTIPYDSMVSIDAVFIFAYGNFVLDFTTSFVC